MSRLHKRLILIFCFGVLLCGVGMGIAFSEFSSLSYGGRLVLGETDIRTETLDVEFEPDEEARRVLWGISLHNPVLLTDNSVPVNTVRFQVTYNANRVEPFAYFSEEDGIVFSWYWKAHEDEMALMMEAKDVVFRNLKEGRLVSFKEPDIEEVKVFVNAASEEDITMGR